MVEELFANDHIDSTLEASTVEVVKELERRRWSSWDDFGTRPVRAFHHNRCEIPFCSKTNFILS